MWFARVLVCFFPGGFEPILHGIDRKGPSKIVLLIREALRLLIGRRELTGAG
jgi:hypothetical protein